MTCFRTASTLSLLISLAVGATSATALNIELIDALWLTDRVDELQSSIPLESR